MSDAPSTRDEINARYAQTPPPKNRALAAIRTIWVISAVLGTLLTIIGIATSGPTPILLGGAFLNLSILGGLIHLAVNAVRWRDPSGN